MDKKPTNSFQTHFMDIHEEVLSEGDEEGTIRNEEREEKYLNKTATKPRELRRNHGRLNRQVSLETGFSVLNRERKGRDERKTLTRSGTSLGGLNPANKIGLEGQKRDFSIFKTKSTLSKQNSLLPRKIEKELESQKINGTSGADDDSVNASVPAGRYFAALRGPELDEVKVRHCYLSFTLLPQSCMNACMLARYMIYFFP